MPKAVVFLLLKRCTKVPGKAKTKLNAVLTALGATSRSWELKECFHRFWLYRSPDRKEPNLSPTSPFTQAAYHRRQEWTIIRLKVEK